MHIKATCRILMKLTSGVNFINVKRTNISYKRRSSSYVLALSKNLYEKRARKTLMKLTSGCEIKEWDVFLLPSFLE